MCCWRSGLPKKVFMSALIAKLKVFWSVVFNHLLTMVFIIASQVLESASGIADAA